MDRVIGAVGVLLLAVGVVMAMAMVAVLAVAEDGDAAGSTENTAAGRAR